MEISIGGADIQEIVSMAATGGVFVLLAGWLWVNRNAIKSALSKVASKVKQEAPATVTAHSCEQFNAEVLDVVGLCIEMGDDEGAAQMLDLMKKHNVAEAVKHQCEKVAAPVSIPSEYV